SLNNKIDELKNDIEELKNDLYEANVYRHSYKLGIDQLEVRIAEYKEKEVKYIETIRSLERDKECNLGKINKLTSDVETLQDEKDLVDGKLARLLKPSPTVASTSVEGQNNDTSTSEEAASTNPSTSFIKFVKPKNSQPESKIEEQETPKKPQVKNSEQNRQRRVQRETNRSQDHSYKSSTHRSTGLRPNGAHMRPLLRSSSPTPHGNSMRPPFRPAGHRPHGPSAHQ
nr:hypothetical protein [Tanacetum cinerariifolium]